MTFYHLAEKALKLSNIQQAVRGIGNERLPDEVGAVATKGRLLEEPWYKFMVLHFVDVLLPQSTFASKPVRHVLGRLI